MEPTEIKKIRTDLGLTQTEFGRLLGLGGATISRWEAGTLHPTAYHAAYLKAFQKKTATTSASNVGPVVAGLIVGAGIIAALTYLFTDDDS